MVSAVVSSPRVFAAGQILVVGGEAAQRAAVTRVLHDAGLASVIERSSLTFSDDLPMPALIIVCGTEPALACGQAREIPLLAEIPILAIVPGMPLDAAPTALAAGADDVVVGDPSAAVLGTRARRLMAQLDDRRAARELDALDAALVRIHELMAEGGDAPETLREILLVAVDTIDFDRGSLIAHVEGSQHAYVVAATDDPEHQQFTLLISDYPEIEAALASGEPLDIPDVRRHPITAPIAATLLDKRIAGLAVFPIVWRSSTLGAVLFRRRRLGATLPSRRLRFGRLLASQLAALIRHSSVMERLRDQTRRISRASYEAERRLRTIESLKEHFEASADGVVVLDEEGRILFVNRTAEAITGFAQDGLMGTKLTELVEPEARDPLEVVIRSVLAGTNLEAFDLDMTTTGGGTICVSVTTSTVLSRSGAVILSIRDVTAQRRLESELQHTKDFLEKLIDSTVDAIIACDMRGRVILFNAGAERIYGYDPESVVNKLHVWRLYPEGVASEVLRMLRSPDYGGVGKLEQTRREILTRDGELVPVNMTASIIYEDDVEVATVGIFTDLRERIRMEQRLLSAQRLLREQEKQAVIAQLAGAAAHELNQPLTSILASSQLLERELPEGDPVHRRVKTVLAEAERMAEMVKKIGRITKFETVQYVGSTDILDLEASTVPSPPPPPERPRRTQSTPPPIPRSSRADTESDAPDDGAVRPAAPDRTKTVKLRIGPDGIAES